MKKTLLGIAGVLAMISSANAVDTAQIKAACQSSDKTLWVERNQVCIPRNPCKNSKYDKYCNRIFRDVQTHHNGYKVMIEVFAKTHTLSCVPVDTNPKIVGQDYVICMGDDVMVFEFDDIHDDVIISDDNYMYNLYPFLCKAIDGNVLQDGNKSKCYTTTKDACGVLNSVLKKHGFGYATWVNNDNDMHCVISAKELAQVEVYSPFFDADINKTVDRF